MDVDRIIEELDRYQSADEALSGCAFAAPMDELIVRRRLAVVFRAMSEARHALASSTAEWQAVADQQRREIARLHALIRRAAELLPGRPEDAEELLSHAMIEGKP